MQSMLPEKILIAWILGRDGGKATKVDYSINIRAKEHVEYKKCMF